MTLPKIVTFAPYPREWMLSFMSRGIDPSSFEFVHSPGAKEEEACKLVKDASILFHGPFEPFISRRILEAADELKLVQFGSVGYSQVDLEAASELNIPVANNAGINAISVAEYTILAILALMRRAFYGHYQNTQGKWVQQEFMGFQDKLCELTGKTVGILGLGNIGTEVAKRLRGFDCRILYNKRNRLSDAEEKAMGVEYASFDRLIEESEVLTVHVPLTDETRGMIGEAEIAGMKDGAILINTARSGIVDEDALAEALGRGKLLGAAIDVPREPDAIPPFQERFGDLENVLITPHIASGSRETGERSRSQLSENVRRVLQGERPLYIVNEM